MEEQRLDDEVWVTLNDNDNKRQVLLAPTVPLTGTELARPYCLDPASIKYLKDGLPRQLGSANFAVNFTDQKGTIDDPIVIKGKPSKEWRKALVALGGSFLISAPVDMLAWANLLKQTILVGLAPSYINAAATALALVHTSAQHAAKLWDLWEVAAEMRIALRATKEACKRRNVAPHLD